MKALLRRTLVWLSRHSQLARILYAFLRRVTSTTRVQGRNNCVDVSKARLFRSKIEVIGDDNIVSIGAETTLEHVEVALEGNYLHLVIGEHSYLGAGTVIRMKDNYGRLEIGNRTTINHAMLIVVEDRAAMRIGNDCMFSREIEIRTSDSHAIYDQETLQRINFPEKVEIEDHVWVGARCMILKGVTIGSGSVVGAGAVVAKSMPPQSVVVGNPARVVRSGIIWTRDRKREFLESAGALTPPGGMV